HSAARRRADAVHRPFVSTREVQRNNGGAGEPAGNRSKDKELAGATSSGHGPMIPPRSGLSPPHIPSGAAPQASAVIASTVVSGTVRLWKGVCRVWGPASARWSFLR